MFSCSFLALIQCVTRWFLLWSEERGPEGGNHRHESVTGTGREKPGSWEGNGELKQTIDRFEAKGTFIER